MYWVSIKGVVATLFTLLSAGVAVAAPTITLRTLSTRPDIISGGDVLVEVTYSSNKPLPLRITLNEREVTDRFRAGAQRNRLIGLVDGLHPGKNILRARAVASRGAEATLELVDYSITGPIFSGPQIQPYRCMTDQFMLPDGSYLGPSTDAQCSAPTKVQYVYKSIHGDFRPMLDITKLPEDVARVTLNTGVTVPYVVRFEAGTIDRGVYNIAILHDPTVEAAPTPFSPPKAWSKKLMWVHGFGCAGGWHYQGTATASTDGYDFPKLFKGGDAIVPRKGELAADFNVLNDTWLSKGYAVATSTLNHPSINCNPHLAGESTSMVKEHFIKEFGVPFFTVSTGGSGGAYSSEQIADAFPGLFDGILVEVLFPDSLSIGMSGLDGHLLTHYFAVTDPKGFSDSQQVAVSGYQGRQALIDAANQAGRTDPVPGRVDIPGYLSAVWYSLGGAWPLLYPTPVDQRYDPINNPKGARPTIFDVSIAIYGRDPATGFALRPFDNVGVQYGLAALNAGTITTTQFLNLNAGIGGYDPDANYVAGRSSADLGAVKRTYQSGLSLGGGGGLASIPVFDFGGYNDSGSYHYQWFHFALRERLVGANGGAENHIMWRGSAIPRAKAASLFDEWVSAYKADTSSLSQRQKVIRDKPAEAVDGCWSSATQFIAESQRFGAQPDSKCNSLFPSYAAPRLVAGGPLAGNVLKCQLKPLDLNDYKVKFTATQWTQLQAIFPSGVCDWSKPGVNQVGVVTWSSFGPSPDHLVYDLANEHQRETSVLNDRSTDSQIK